MGDARPLPAPVLAPVFAQFLQRTEQEGFAMRKLKTAAAGACAVAFGWSNLGAAAGFEKAVLWSPQWAALGGAAAAAVSGPESLLFNPAGLALGQGGEVELDFSPTFSNFEGPVFQANTSVSSEWGFSPIAGAVASYKLLPRLGVGAGFFVSGGTNATFRGLSATSVNAALDTITPDALSQLSVTEASVGLAYEILSGLRLGVSWRAVFVSADVATPLVVGTGPATVLVGLNLNDLSASKFNGFRAGLQFAPENMGFGIGVNYRNSIDFTAEGTSSGQFEAVAGGSAAAITGGAATLSSTFPQQLSVGGFVDPVKTFRVLAEWTLTEYSTVRQLSPTGTITVGATPVDLATQPIITGWRNQHNFRGGLEYTGIENTAIRGGYVLTTQVTPEERARATFASPGIGNTIVLGAGRRFMEQKLSVDIAAEYSFASGDVTLLDLIPYGTTATPGTYKSQAWVGHFGVSYRF